MTTGTCERCGAPTIPLFTGFACEDECDLRDEMPRQTSSDELTHNGGIDSFDVNRPDDLIFFLTVSLSPQDVLRSLGLSQDMSASTEHIRWISTVGSFERKA